MKRPSRDWQQDLGNAALGVLLTLAVCYSLFKDLLS